jgi:drug/metabolite transporter (DMT)-like permease
MNVAYYVPDIVYDIAVFLSRTDYTMLALASAAFGAASNIMAKRLFVSIKPKDAMSVTFLTMFSVLTFLMPIYFKFNPTFIAVILVLSVAIIDFLSNYFFFKSFENSDVSIVTCVHALAPAFSFVFSWIFLADFVTIKQFVLSIGIMLSIIIFSYKPSSNIISDNKAIISAITAAVLFGLSAIPAKYLLSTGATNAPTLYEMRAGLIGLASILIWGSGFKALKVSYFRFIFPRSMLVIAQWLLLYLALSKGNAGVTLTLANVTPFFVAVASYFLFGDRFTMRKVAAVSLVIILSVSIQ